VVHPGDEISRWPEYEAIADEMFLGSFGSGAPWAVREMAEDVRRRVVFGWPALREKLLCQEHGIADVSMELFKAAVLRYVPGALFSDETELRLDGANDNDIVLTWFMAGTEQRLSRVTVPRHAFSSFEREPDWDALRATFNDARFVDVQRLMSRE